MALLFLSDFQDAKVWSEAIKKLDPQIEIYCWPEVPHPEKVEFIGSWSYEDVDYTKFPNLKAVSSLAAGIDHFKLNKIPQHVPVARIIDPDMRVQMSEYVILAVMNYRRHFIAYKQQQQQKIWCKIPEIEMIKLTVGIMGIGSLGLNAALKLRNVGYPVIGWSRTKKTIADIQIFAGEAELPDFLRRTKILICFLPVTAKTKNILNAKLFAMLPQGAYIINVARGALLVEEDLIKFINNGHLAGACLDVYRQEPLPMGHPFWQHPRIMMTPHMSSNPILQTAVQQIVTNYHRMQRGQKLLNEVNKNFGY